MNVAPSSPLNFVLRLNYLYFESPAKVASTIRYLKETRFQGLMLIPGLGGDLNHLPFAIIQNRAKRLVEVVPEFKAAGLSVGLNLPSTIGFSAPPDDTEDFGFQYQVDVHGKEYRNRACPLSPQFLAYLDRLVEAYAVDGLDYLMTDDEFNYMIGPAFCFCPLHMKRFGMSREEWVSRIPSPGQLAERWADVQADAFLEAARVVERAAHRRNPGLRLGFMGVNGYVCDFGSEFFRQMIEIMGGPQKVPPVVRPSAGFYYDFNRFGAHGPLCPHSELFVRTVVPRECLSLIEADPGAPWTPFSHGAEHVRFCIERSLATGTRGFAFCLFPSEAGNRLEMNHPYTAMLAKHRRRFDAIAELVGDDLIFEGVDCRPVDGMNKIDPLNTAFYGVPAFPLSRLGIALAPTGEWVTVQHGKHPWVGLATGGDMKAPAVEMWKRLPVGIEMTDHTLNGSAAGAFWSNTLPATYCGRLIGEYRDADVLSWWVDDRGKQLGPCEVAQEIDGDRQVLLAYRLDLQDALEQTFVANHVRQPMFQNLCEWVAGRPLPAVVRDGVDFVVFTARSADNKRRLLTLVNNGFNRFDSLTVELATLPSTEPTIRTVAEHGSIRVVQSLMPKHLKDRWQLSLQTNLIPGPMEVRVLSIE